MKDFSTGLVLIPFQKEDIKIAKELMCPNCGNIGSIFPVAGELYPDGSVKPPHFECIKCNLEGFEHNFKKIKNKETK